MTDIALLEARLAALEAREQVRAARAAALAVMTPAQRQAEFEASLTRGTAGDDLPLIDDYNLPADVPAANNALASATQTALNNHRATSDARYVQGPGGVRITDWNAATLAGFYWSELGASNRPAASEGDDYWIGWTAIHNDSWVHQYATAIGASGQVPAAAVYHRTRSGGAWGSWTQLGASVYSWGTASRGLYWRHGADGAARFAALHAKSTDQGATLSSLDEWRLQCYDQAGQFTWSAIKVPESGVVSMPRGHALLLERLASGEPLPADQVVTVGALAKLLARILDPDDPLTLETLPVVEESP